MKNIIFIKASNYNIVERKLKTYLKSNKSLLPYQLDEFKEFIVCICEKIVEIERLKTSLSL
jgi:hypothetical protein